MSHRADIYLRSLPEEHWLRVLHTRFENGSLSEPIEDIQPLIDCIARKPVNLDVLKYGVKLGYAVRKKKPLLNPDSKIVNLIEPVVAMSLLNKIPLTFKQVTQICEQFRQNNFDLNDIVTRSTNHVISIYLIISFIDIILFTTNLEHTILIFALSLIIPIFLVTPVIAISINAWIYFNIEFRKYEISFYHIHPSRTAIPSLVEQLLRSYRAKFNKSETCRDLLNTLYICTQVENNDSTHLFDTRSTKSISLLLLQLNRMIPNEGNLYPFYQQIQRFLSPSVLTRKTDVLSEEPESYLTLQHKLRLPLMLGLIRSLEESGDASCLKTLQRLAARGYCPDVKQAALKASPVVQERSRLNQQPSTLLRAASGHDSSSLLLPATSEPLSNFGLLKQTEYPNGITTSTEASATVVIKNSE